MQWAASTNATFSSQYTEVANDYGDVLTALGGYSNVLSAINTLDLAVNSSTPWRINEAEQDLEIALLEVDSKLSEAYEDVWTALEAVSVSDPVSYYQAQVAAY